jgi:hypothetical protein
METTTTTDNELDTCFLCGAPTDIVIDDEFIDEPAALCLDCNDEFSV